jgi:hypothetical protein
MTSTPITSTTGATMTDCDRLHCNDTIGRCAKCPQMTVDECIALVEGTTHRYFAFTGVEHRMLIQILRGRMRSEVGTTHEIMRRILQKLEAAR